MFAYFLIKKIATLEGERKKGRYQEILSINYGQMQKFF